MTTFSVWTVVTAYEKYTVEADSAEEAKAIVADSEKRGELPSAPERHNADEHVIEVREQRL